MTKHLQPMFATAAIWELLVISIMAGIGEEIFFRWCLQGGAFSTLEPWIGWAPAIGVSLILTSLLFGTCHWVNTTYFLFATLAGLYFGAVMIWTESWPAAAIGHALFDFAALLYIKALPRSNEESPTEGQ